MKLTQLSKSQRILLWSIVALVIVVTMTLYLQYSKYHPSTDDAYVNANVVNIAAQVSGPVKDIYVQDHQVVQQNQVLFTIDPAPFQLAVDEAGAKLANTQQQTQGSQDAVDAAQALVDQRQAELVLAQKNAERILSLVQQKLASPAQGDEAQSKFRSAVAALNAAQDQLEQAKQQLGDPGVNNALVRAAQAALSQAELNLSYTKITAPAAGYLVNFNLRPGTMVAAGEQLFALVETNDWWVEANFKETDINRIKPGQPVNIQLDMYPGVRFKGVVQSISRGSGEVFSLLPPEQATGTWVKVTQRFPLRIKIINPDPKHPLRVGASATVTVDTLE